MMGFLVAIELQRRGMPLPLRVFCSCRGAPHICSRHFEELKELYLMDDAGTIAWAERAGVLPPAALRGNVRVSKRFAPTARSDMPLGILEVGTRVSEPAPLSAAASASDGVVINHKAPSVYAKEPPRLRTPLVALLGGADEMWPSEQYLSGWAQVAHGGFRGVTIRNTPHHELQSHPVMQAEVHAECAQALLARLEEGVVTHQPPAPGDEHK